MVITTETEKQEEWLDLEAIFLGRTIHVHSLSPLHLRPPSKKLSQSHLDSLAKELQGHLSARLNDSFFISHVGSTSTSEPSDVIRKVRASYIDEPRLRARDVPNPFVIEIQINQPYPTAENPDEKRLETAHLIFLSTSTRQTGTHYPLLLWKATLAGRSAPLESQYNEGANDPSQYGLNTKLLTSYTLGFITAFFDCRLSTLSPLQCFRGKNLEEIAQSIIAFEAEEGDISSSKMELTFALPTQVDPFQDDEIIAGPAPLLNTVSLDIPSAVIDALKRDSSIRSHLFSTLSGYLSDHTSIQISKLTLVRVGVGPVYIGSPTSIVTQGGRSNGEVRLKIQKDKGGRSRYDLIVLILSQLIEIAQREE